MGKKVPFWHFFRKGCDSQLFVRVEPSTSWNFKTWTGFVSAYKINGGHVSTFMGILGSFFTFRFYLKTIYGSPYVHLQCSLQGFTKPKFTNTNFTPLRWQTVLGGLGKTSWLAGTSLECIRIVIEPNWNVMYIMWDGLWGSNFAQT